MEQIIPLASHEDREEVPHLLIFPMGYLSSDFTIDKKDMHVRVKNAHIILIDYEITHMQQMLPILERVMQNKIPSTLLISQEKRLPSVLLEHLN